MVGVLLVVVLVVAELLLWWLGFWLGLGMSWSALSLFFLVWLFSGEAADDRNNGNGVFAAVIVEEEEDDEETTFVSRLLHLWLWLVSADIMTRMVEDCGYTTNCGNDESQNRSQQKTQEEDKLMINGRHKKSRRRCGLDGGGEFVFVDKRRGSLLLASCFACWVRCLGLRCLLGI